MKVCQFRKNHFYNKIPFTRKTGCQESFTNLTPWRDSNPASSVLEADPMTTMLRHRLNAFFNMEKNRGVLSTLHFQQTNCFNPFLQKWLVSREPKLHMYCFCRP
jgi:hypothetical protein